MNRAAASQRAGPGPLPPAEARDSATQSARMRPHRAPAGRGWRNGWPSKGGFVRRCKNRLTYAPGDWCEKRDFCRLKTTFCDQRGTVLLPLRHFFGGVDALAGQPMRAEKAARMGPGWPTSRPPIACELAQTKPCYFCIPTDSCDQREINPTRPLQDESSGRGARPCRG